MYQRTNPLLYSSFHCILQKFGPGLLKQRWAPAARPFGAGRTLTFKTNSDGKNFVPQKHLIKKKILCPYILCYHNIISSICIVISCTCSSPPYSYAFPSMDTTEKD